MHEYLFYIGLAFSVLTVVVHIMLALAIWDNAGKRESEKKPLMYLGASGWALTTLIFGLLGLLAYWFIHHSALRKLYSPEGPEHEHNRH